MEPALLKVIGYCMAATVVYLAGVMAKLESQHRTMKLVLEVQYLPSDVSGLIEAHGCMNGEARL